MVRQEGRWSNGRFPFPKHQRIADVAPPLCSSTVPPLSVVAVFLASLPTFLPHCFRGGIEGEPWVSGL